MTAAPIPRRWYSGETCTFATHTSPAPTPVRSTDAGGGADRAAGDRAVPRGPHADPFRGPGRARARLRLPAPTGLRVTGATALRATGRAALSSATPRTAR